MYMETVQASKHGPHIIYDYTLMRTLAKSLVQHSASCSNIWPVTSALGSCLLQLLQILQQHLGVSYIKAIVFW